MKRAFAATLLLCGAVALSSTTFAASGDEPSTKPGGEPDDEGAGQITYKRHMDTGVALYREGRFEEAISEFRAAHRSLPKASPLINLALAYKKLSRYAEAVDVLEQALADHEDTMTANDKAAAQKEIKSMKARVAYVVLDVNPADARLFVDDQSRRLKSPLTLAPGTHRLRFEADGFETVRKTIEVASGEDNEEVSVKMEAVGGEISIDTGQPEARIAIDNQEVGRGKWSGPLSSGVHAVTVGEGAETQSIQVVVTPGKIHTVSLDEQGKLVSDASTRPAGDGSEADANNLTGLYLVGGGGVGMFTTLGPLPKVGVLRRPGYESGSRVSPSVVIHGNAIVGYRVAPWAAFQINVGYYRLVVSENVATLPANSRTIDWRSHAFTLAPQFRVMLPGTSQLRFFADAGVGPIFTVSNFSPNDIDRIDAGDIIINNTTDIGLFALVDLGAQFEVSKVLFEVFASTSIRTLNQLSPDITVGQKDTEVDLFQGSVGAGLQLAGGLRVGYSLW